MMSHGVAVETAQGMQERGELDGIGPNAMVVRLMGVQLVTGQIPRDVRNELMAAVKAGKIGRLPKKGLLPEAFFHPNGKANALSARERVERQSIEAQREALRKVLI